MTPAQAYGHPNFVDDVPVQGPTDQGIREADCRYRQNVLPARPACADCGEGPIPMWTQRTGVQGYSGLGELIAIRGVGSLGFALDGASDPEVWTKQSSAQQAWIADTMRVLNDQIMKATGTSCPTWNPSNIASITGCFQVWFNANYRGKLTGANGAPVGLRSDGVFDQETLDALITIAGMNPTAFPKAYPGGSLPGPATQVDKKGLSKGAIAGIAAGGIAAVGLAYAATRKKRR